MEFNQANQFFIECVIVLHQFESLNGVTLCALQLDVKADNTTDAVFVWIKDPKTEWGESVLQTVEHMIESNVG